MAFLDSKGLERLWNKILLKFKPVDTGNYGNNNTINVTDKGSVFGNANTIGGNGYKILKYTFAISNPMVALDPNVTVYEGTTSLELSSTTGITVGDIVSIEMNDSTQRFATIQSISGNTVVLDKAYYDETVANVNENGEILESDVSNNNFHLILPEVENSGDSKVAESGYVLGKNNRTVADNAFATGSGNSAEGKNAFVSGENNIGGYNALVGGEDNVITAEHGFGVGYKNTATARYAAVIGYNNDATGPASMAVGDNTTASGVGALAQGYNTTASGSHSHAEGASTDASGIRSHAEGYGSKAAGYAAHAEGYFTKALHDYSHAEGANSVASAKHAHAEGDGTNASGIQAHAEGLRSAASGENSHAEGADTKAEKAQAHAEGLSTTASGFDSHAEGSNTIASGDQSHAEGYYATAEGMMSHAEGQGTKATASWSHAEGYSTTASGLDSHAEGNSTEASGNHSHAEGYYTVAREGGAHAEGERTQATGSNAHAEGIQTKATGAFSHAENCYTEATGARSHAEGNRAKANGESSHAGGHYSQANGKYSFAHGEQVIADQQSQFVVGQYNNNKSDTLFEIGNGTSDTNRKNAFEVKRDNTAFVGDKKIATEEVVDEKILASATHYGAAPAVVASISAAENDRSNASKLFELRPIKGQTVLVHRYNEQIDEWYSLEVNVQRMAMDASENAPIQDAYGYVEVDGIFIIRDAGTPQYEWVNFGYLHVTDKDGNACFYDIFDDLTVEKKIDPRYLPINAIKPNVDIFTQPTAPATANEGDIWFDTSKSFIDVVYPVGSIYMSVDSASPASLFGGTWEAIQSRFLVGKDNGQFITAGAMGGEAYTSLTISQIPSHRHSTYGLGVDSSSLNANASQAWSAMRGVDRSNHLNTTEYTASEGGGQPHNNLPPYLVVYMWKRTA